MQPSPQDPKPSPPKTERKSSVSSFLHKAKDFAHDLTHKEKRKSGDHPAQKGQGEQVARHDEPAVQGAGRDGFGKNQYETGKHEGREPMGGSSTISERREESKPAEGGYVPSEQTTTTGAVGGVHEAPTTATSTENGTAPSTTDNPEQGFASQVNKKLDSKFGEGTGGEPASTSGFGGSENVGSEQGTEGVEPYRVEPELGEEGGVETGGVDIPSAAQASAHGGTGFSP